MTLDVVVDAGARGLQQSAQFRVQAGGQLLTNVVESPGAQVAIGGQQAGTHFRQAALAGAVDHIHLEKALRRHQITGGVEQVVFITSVEMGHCIAVKIDLDRRTQSR